MPELVRNLPSVEIGERSLASSDPHDFPKGDSGVYGTAKGGSRCYVRAPCTEVTEYRVRCVAFVRRKNSEATPQK